MGDTSLNPDLDASNRRVITDGGMETDRIVHHGVNPPEFAAQALHLSDVGISPLRADDGDSRHHQRRG